MRVYQTSDRTYYWNEAHNQYLQVAAEGGLLLAAPAGLALFAMAAAGYRALRRRDRQMDWMRLGAAAGLVAAAVQAFWETGLSLPANGMLAAVAAAVLLHDVRDSPHAASRS
jgi:O-antigen ligase